MGKRKSGASSTFPETITQQPAQLRSAAGPYAVYFPSGYDPATGVKWETYTHAKKRHSLIVGRTVGAVVDLGGVACFAEEVYACSHDWHSCILTTPAFASILTAG